MRNNINSPVLSITVTRNCNLNCSYCYFPNKGNKTITKDIVDTIIENYFAFFTNGINEVRFLLSGGEPLMEKDLVFYIMELATLVANRHNKKISFTLDTNGVLLSNKIVDRLKPYDVYVMSSIDGKAETHNLQRPFTHTNSGSHEIIVKNVDYALKALGKNNVAVRFTVLPNGIENLYETFLYFYEMGFKIIDFAPNYEDEWSEKQMQTYKTEIYKISSFILKNSIDNKLVNNYLQYHLGKTKQISAYGHLCGIIPTVDTNGDFYACHRFIDNDNFYLGDYKNFGTITSSIRSLSKQYIKYWNKYDYYALASCPANNVCHECGAFEVSDFFKNFIDIMMEQTEKAIYNNADCVFVEKIMDYTIHNEEETEEYVLVNNANGEYILMNETGNILAQILQDNNSLSFEKLVEKFVELIEHDNSIDKEQIKKDILVFLKELQNEKIITLSVK